MRELIRSVFLACAQVAMIVHPASAAVWTVEKDGSGEFMVIQDALNIAASGDTVAIGPGRFDDVHTFQFPGGTTDGHCLARQDEITIIGAGQDLTVIGPEAGPGGQFEPDGVITDENTILRLAGLTVENCEDGIEMNGRHGYVREYLSRNNYIGIGGVLRDGGLEVRGSQFMDIQLWGIIVFDVLSASGILIEDCAFRDGAIGIDLQSDDNMVRGCTFENLVVGLQFSFGAYGSIETSTFGNSTNWDVVLTSASQAHLTGNRLGVSAGNVNVSNGSTLTGSGNILRGGTVATIRMIVDTTIDFHGNHILNAGSWSAFVATSSTTPVSFDLTNNYWGTDDPAQISEWIRDKEDGATRTTVLFEPFSAVPLPTQKRSMSSLKAVFRSPR